MILRENELPHFLLIQRVFDESVESLFQIPDQNIILNVLDPLVNDCIILKIEEAEILYLRKPLLLCFDFEILEQNLLHHSQPQFLHYFLLQEFVVDYTFAEFGLLFINNFKDQNIINSWVVSASGLIESHDLPQEFVLKLYLWVIPPGAGDVHEWRVYWLQLLIEALACVRGLDDTGLNWTLVF